MSKKSFLDRFTEKAEALDPGSRQAYILRLARERGFFETVFNSIEEGILIVDRRLHIKYCNQAAVTLLGLPDNLKEVRLSQFLRGVNWRRILDDDADEWLRVSRQEIEISYPETRFVQFCLVPLEEDARMAAVVIHDVTSERTERMHDFKNETNKQIAMLAGAVAHEIGNPLNSLYLNLQLLEKEAETPGFLGDSEAREMIESCRSEVERLDNIITQFLGAIRPGESCFEQLFIDKVLIDTLNFMRQEIEQRNIELKCEFPENVPHIMGNPTQLKQLFYNIIKNALQATVNGGSLILKISYDRDYLLVECADSGRGIEAAEISRIFKPFQTFKADGNGLGMVIIERIVREHGAELGVDSQPGLGTIVSIRFRRRPRQMRVLPE